MTTTWVELEAPGAFHGEGRTSSARACAAHAQTLLQQCAGAHTPALRAAGAFEGLTPREREIATLAARGLPTRAIANRLVVSPRTVDNHLQRTYRKLGITSRSELVSLLEIDEME